MACLGKAGVDVGWAEVVADGGVAANSWMVRSCGVPNTYKDFVAPVCRLCPPRDTPMIPRYVPLLFDPRRWTAPNCLATSLKVS